ncbi:MAG: zinc ABC transporter substrate-binding protein [Brachymonas sp.]|nr:zinc ABC transporter substrate-binding protein [Brachymonas sp.]
MLAACTQQAPQASKAQAAASEAAVVKKLHVLATTTMLQDLAAAIGGERVQATALMGPGIDPHLYQASAGDVKTMQGADVVAYHGLHLEGKMDEVFASLAKQGRPVIHLGEGLDKAKLLADEDNPQLHDPHIWFDVAIWKEAAQYMADRLASIDPQHAAAYSANLKTYLLQLDELDQYMKQRVQEVPAGQRVLVTAHDAFRYFGRAYGFEVMGLQGISTEAEAGTADVSKLAAFIADRRIKAIFVESSVPHKNVEALQAAVKARGFEVAIGGELYSDALGDAASGHNTYLSTLKANIDTLVDALK